MKIGLLFGSFNPIHTGHLIIANYIVNNFADKVWFVVSPQNPLKKNSELLNIEDRIFMVKTAINDNEKFEVCDIEVSLPVPSYTIDTIFVLKDLHPDHNFFLIMGSDIFLNISEWKSSEILLRDYNILVYERPGFRLRRHKFHSNIIKLQSPYINISSTEIRNLIKEGKSIRYITPAAISELIYSRGFYI